MSRKNGFFAFQKNDKFSMFKKNKRQTLKLSLLPQIAPSKPQIAAFETFPEPTRLLFTRSAQDISRERFWNPMYFLFQQNRHLSFKTVWLLFSHYFFLQYEYISGEAWKRWLFEPLAHIRLQRADVLFTISKGYACGTVWFRYAFPSNDSYFSPYRTISTRAK